jgi:serine/threonine protein phosphatase PrpC
MFIGFKAVEQGLSHKEIDKECQDSAYSFVNKEKSLGIAVVADGHGSEKHFRSKQGSEFAVYIAKDVISRFYKIAAPVLHEFIETGNNKKAKDFLDKNLPTLEQEIIRQWRSRTIANYKNVSLKEEEQLICNELNINIDNEDDITRMYGTTLIAAFVTNEFWFAIQIGDGLCVMLPQSENPKTAVPGDDRLAFGRTTSLCDTDAAKNFRHNFAFEKILGITVATDGVTDSFETEKYLEFNTELRKDFKAFPEQAESELRKFLPELSERGSRDDVAIAGVFDLGE